MEDLTLAKPKTDTDTTEAFENVPVSDPAPTVRVTLTGACLDPSTELMQPAGTVLTVTREQANALLKAGKILRPSWL